MLPAPCKANHAVEQCVNSESPNLHDGEQCGAIPPLEGNTYLRQGNRTSAASPRWMRIVEARRLLQVIETLYVTHCVDYPSYTVVPQLYVGEVERVGSPKGIIDGAHDCLTCACAPMA